MIQSSPRNFPNGLVLPWPPLPEVYNQIGGISFFNIITMKMENNWDFLSSSCCWDSKLCSPGIISKDFIYFLSVFSQFSHLVYPEGSCDQVWSISRINSRDEPPGLGRVLLDADVVGVGVDVPPKIMLLLIEQIFTTEKLYKDICLLMNIFH